MDQWTTSPMDQWTNGPMDQCTFDTERVIEETLVTLWKEKNINAQDLKKWPCLTGYIIVHLHYIELLSELINSAITGKMDKEADFFQKGNQDQDQDQDQNKESCWLKLWLCTLLQSCSWFWAKHMMFVSQIWYRKSSGWKRKIDLMFGEKKHQQGLIIRMNICFLCLEKQMFKDMPNNSCKTLDSERKCSFIS